MQRAAALGVVLCGIWSTIAAGQFYCDTSRLTNALVRDCANAMRTAPGRFDLPCVQNPRPTTHALRPNSALALAAQRHADDMASRDYFSHTSLDGRSFATRIRAAQYNGSLVGENLAKGFQSAFGVTRGWMCSPGHRRNLMSCSYNEVGTGVNCRQGPCYVVQVYGCAGSNCCSRGALQTASKGQQSREPKETPENRQMQAGQSFHQFPAPLASERFRRTRRTPFRRSLG